MNPGRGAAASAPLLVLFLVNVLNFYDRQVLGAVLEPLHREFGLSDTRLAALATAFTLLYAVAGLAARAAGRPMEPQTPARDRRQRVGDADCPRGAGFQLRNAARRRAWESESARPPAPPPPQAGLATWCPPIAARALWPSS